MLHVPVTSDGCTRIVHRTVLSRPGGGGSDASKRLLLGSAHGDNTHAACHYDMHAIIRYVAELVPYTVYAALSIMLQ